MDVGFDLNKKNNIIWTSGCRLPLANTQLLFLYHSLTFAITLSSVHSCTLATGRCSVSFLFPFNSALSRHLFLLSTEVHKFGVVESVVGAALKYEPVLRERRGEWQDEGPDWRRWWIEDVSGGHCWRYLLLSMEMTLAAEPLEERRRAGRVESQFWWSVGFDSSTATMESNDSD